MKLMISLYDNYVTGIGSNSWPMDLQSDALPCIITSCLVMIMSDCKTCMVIWIKKRQERMRDLLFPQKFGLLWYVMPQLQRIWNGILCLLCSLFRSFCFFTGAWTIVLGKDIRNLCKYVHIHLLSFTPYKTIWFKHKRDCIFLPT